MVDAAISHEALTQHRDGKSDSSVSVNDDRINSWTTVTNNLVFLDELLYLYFSWCHPSHRLFRQEYISMRDKRDENCTPLLMNAIFALGCLFSDRPEAYSNPEDPNSKGDHFFAECERLVPDEKFSLPTIQASALMTIFLVMKDKIKEAKVCAGLMRNMFLDTRLNEFAPRGIPDDVLQDWRVTFWGCLNLETNWALCRGQHTFIDENVFCRAKPAVEQDRDATIWSPYGLPIFQNVPLQSHQDSLLMQSCLLFHLVDRMLRIFYAPHERITASRLMQHHQKLDHWLQNLPNSLRIHDGPMLPQVITMQ